jgi:hypothetical protein
VRAIAPEQADRLDVLNARIRFEGVLQRTSLSSGPRVGDVNRDGPPEHQRRLLARAHHRGACQAGDGKKEGTEGKRHEARQRKDDL